MAIRQSRDWVAGKGGEGGGGIESPARDSRADAVGAQERWGIERRSGQRGRGSGRMEVFFPWWLTGITIIIVQLIAARFAMNYDDFNLDHIPQTG